MASFMVVGDPTIVQSLIHKVVDFKERVKGYDNEFGQDRLLGIPRRTNWYAYVGPTSSQPTETFRPGTQIRVGCYVLLRPSEDCLELV